MVSLRPHQTAGEADEQMDLLIGQMDKLNLSFAHCLLARDNGQMLASCLSMDSPGRVSSVIVPQVFISDKVADASVALLREAVKEANERGIVVVQGMFSAEGEQISDIYRRADFQYLTHLLYLKCDLGWTDLAYLQSPALNWETYSSQTHALFVRVIQGTYENSLDCAILSKHRDIEDIIASHRFTGVFDADCWLMGLKNGAPVGIILLSYFPGRSSYEVAYMGLLPDFRGQGYGVTMFRRVISIARSRGVDFLTLTVDSDNLPAIKLYRKIGFYEYDGGDIWIRLAQAG
ncbi:MAG: GNAT family N-acetyltransferase [Planctomycetota bacterium]